MPDVEESTPRERAQRQERLDQAARDARDTIEKISGVHRCLGAPLEQVREAARTAELAAVRTLNDLMAAGAAPPFDAVRKHEEQQAAREREMNLLDLAALAQLATPEARELLTGVRALIPLAEAVDAQRGRVHPESVPLAPGETRGSDLAEALAAIVRQLAREVEGALGKDEDRL